MRRGLGYKRDVHSDADILYGAALAGAVPTVALLTDQVTEVLDQKSLGSCVANAGAQALRMALMREGVQEPTLPSRLFGYYFARSIDHTTGEDAGTHPRSFFRAVNKLGFPPEELWPYSDDPQTFKRMPSFSALHAAFDSHAPTDYQRIAGTGEAKIQAVKRALAAYRPVVFGCLVDEAFCEGSFDATEPLAPIDEAHAVGGHCMLFDGYDGDRFRVLNSWSDQWGEAGRCWFTPEAVIAATDLWVVAHTPMPGEK